MLDEQWDSGSRTLSGTSAVVAEDPYILTVHLPGSFRIEAAEVDGNKIAYENRGEIATVRWTAGETTPVDWSIRFAN